MVIGAEEVPQHVPLPNNAEPPSLVTVAPNTAEVAVIEVAVGESSVGTLVTIKLNVVVLLGVPALVPVTVIVEVPIGVVPPTLVAIVNVLEQVGLQETGANEAVAKLGSPEAEKLTL